MRDSHPGLFRAMLRTGGFAIVNGIGMLVWPSRLPAWLPPSVLGIASLVLGAAIVAGAFAPTPSAVMVGDKFVEPPPHPALIISHIALGILAAYYFALCFGLFLGWDPSPFRPGVITPSLDRILLYGFAGGVAIDLLREPSTNPVSARKDLER